MVSVVKEAVSKYMCSWFVPGVQGVQCKGITHLCLAFVRPENGTIMPNVVDCLSKFIKR
jgi:hypothetical protein